MAAIVSHSAGSTLLVAAGALPLVAVRLQLHRSTLQRSRPLSVPSPPQQQQRGQPFTPITPLKSTPQQLRGLWGRLSPMQWRQQHSREMEHGPDDLLLSAPQERGWAGVVVGATAVIVWIYAKSKKKIGTILFTDAAKHWDLQAYKRGGGLSHSPPLPATEISTVSPHQLRALKSKVPLTLQSGCLPIQSAFERNTRSWWETQWALQLLLADCCICGCDLCLQ